LHQSLQNFSIDLKIEINEETVKKFAYTDQEKYEKLKEKNPALEQLRQTFQLDI
jgi:DNA polymerase-3 subunit gamma/tau